MQIISDDVGTLLTLDEIEIFSRQKEQLPGDFAIRYAAVVLVILFIGYK